MKRNLFYLTILAFIALLFFHYSIVLDASIKAVHIWLYKVFPYLFIMILLNDLLIKLDFKRVFKNSIHYIFVMSILSGTPTNAYIITNLYQEKKISKNNANYALIFTYFCNPLFLFSILTLIFKDSFIVFKLMSIHYLSNIILYFFYHKKLEKETVFSTKAIFDLAGSIKKSMSTVIMVLGTIVLYMVISDVLLQTFSFSSTFELILRGTLEITQGLNSLISFAIPTKIKEIIAISFISFGGLSIHTQIKCILEETDISYSYFLKGRILGLILSILMVAASCIA